MPTPRSPTKESGYKLRNRDLTLTTSSIASPVTEATASSSNVPSLSIQSTNVSDTTISTVAIASLICTTDVQKSVSPKYGEETAGMFSNISQPTSVYTAAKSDILLQESTSYTAKYLPEDVYSRTAFDKPATMPFPSKPTVSENIPPAASSPNTTQENVIHQLAQATLMNSNLIHLLSQQMESVRLSNKNDALRPDYGNLLSKITPTDGFSPEILLDFMVQIDEITLLDIVSFHLLVKSILPIVQGELRKFFATCMVENLETSKNQIIRQILYKATNK